MGSSPSWPVVVLAASGALLASPLLAHDLPQGRVVTAFVKAESQTVHLVLRLPLDAVETSFPAQGNLIDIQSATGATVRALAALDAAISLRDRGTMLTSSQRTARLSLPSDRSFDAYGSAVAHVATSPSSDAEIYVGQGYLDAHLVYPTRSVRPDLTIRFLLGPGAAESRTTLQLKYLSAGNVVRGVSVPGNSGWVALTPRPYPAARRLAARGLSHALTSVRHLLFVICLILPLRNLRPVTPVLVAFALSHATAVIGSMYTQPAPGNWFGPLIETAVSVSIVFAALANLTTISLRGRRLLAGAGGLVHGLASAQALQAAWQFTPAGALGPILAFNLAVEGGHLIVLALLFVVVAVTALDQVIDRIACVLVSALVVHSGWHWMIGAGSALLQTEPPEVDRDFAGILGRWTTGVLVSVGAARMVADWVERRVGSPMAARQSTAD